MLYNRRFKIFGHPETPRQRFQLTIPDVETVTVSQLKKLLWEQHKIESSNIHKMITDHGFALEDESDFENELITYGISHNDEILLITNQYFAKEKEHEIHVKNEYDDNNLAANEEIISIQS